MMRRTMAVLGCSVWAAAVWVTGGCEKEMTPSRDQIPTIKAAVYSLQERVKERDRAGIDSLLSARILDNKQSGDSLLSFVYGPSGDFHFEQFGGCDIAYTRENAEANCFIMDTTHDRSRPLRLSFVKVDTLWLLASFAEGKPDSTGIDSAVAQ